MLIFISSDCAYRNHLLFSINSLDKSQRTRLSQTRFKSALYRLKKLRVDLVSDLLRSLYSPIGRPANDPAIYFRSFILMQHLGYTSIDTWVKDVLFDSLLQFLIGSSFIPNAASHYDFINRLTHDSPRRSSLFPKDKNKMSKSKLRKGQKLENFTTDDTSSLVDSYNYLLSLHTIPIIDINCRRKDKNPFASFHDLDSNSISICMNAIPMVYDGYEAKRHRNKYRCPLALGKISSCPHKAKCCPDSDYGKIRYIKELDDIKLFGPVPYKSVKWKEIYKDRTSTGRMNNRLLNDYNLHNMKIRNRAKFLFFSIFAGINIHLDTQLKL